MCILISVFVRDSYRGQIDLYRTKLVHKIAKKSKTEKATHIHTQIAIQSLVELRAVLVLFHNQLYVRVFVDNRLENERKIELKLNGSRGVR